MTYHQNAIFLAIYLLDFTDLIIWGRPGLVNRRKCCFLSSAGNYIFYTWYDYAPRMVHIGNIPKLFLHTFLTGLMLTPFAGLSIYFWKKEIMPAFFFHHFHSFRFVIFSQAHIFHLLPVGCYEFFDLKIFGISSIALSIASPVTDGPPFLSADRFFLACSTNHAYSSSGLHAESSFLLCP